MIPVRSLTYEGHRLSEALWVFAEFFSECLLLLAQLEHFILLTLFSLLFLQSFDLWFPINIYFHFINEIIRLKFKLNNKYVSLTGTPLLPTFRQFQVFNFKIIM